MDRSEISQVVRRVIGEVTNRQSDLESIEENVDLAKAIGMTSLEAVEILVRLESELDVQVVDEDLTMELVSNMGNLIRYFQVAECQANRGGRKLSATATGDELA
jgi:acyl carrier protein